jgi:hypothetical protein
VKHKREDDLNDHSAERDQNSQNLRGSDIFEVVQMRAHSPTLSSLPTELHDLIFQKLDIEDVLSLGFTNQYFWSISRRHIQDFFISFLAPWAGETIICVGDYLEVGDYPPCILTKEQEEELQPVLSKYGEDHGRAELMNLCDSR